MPIFLLEQGTWMATLSRTCRVAMDGCNNAPTEGVDEWQCAN
jgi:hypothetical protein